MWNIYVILLLAMYAPSHKFNIQPSSLLEDDENVDLISMGPTESAQMTTLLKTSTEWLFFWYVVKVPNNTIYFIRLLATLISYKTGILLI